MTNKKHIPKWILESNNVSITNDTTDGEYKVFIPEIMIIAYLDMPEKLGERIVTAVYRHEAIISSKVYPNVSIYSRQYDKICEIETDEFVTLLNSVMKGILGTSIIAGYHTTTHATDAFPHFGKGTLSSINTPRSESDQSKEEMEKEMDEAIASDIDNAYNNLLLGIFNHTFSGFDSESDSICPKLKDSERVPHVPFPAYGRIHITENDTEYCISLPNKLITGPTYPVIHVENLDNLIGSLLCNNICRFLPPRHEHIRFSTRRATGNGSIGKVDLFRIKTHDFLSYFGYGGKDRVYNHSVGVLGFLIRKAYTDSFSSGARYIVHDVASSQLKLNWVTLEDDGLVITVNGNDLLTEPSMQHFGSYLCRNAPLDNASKYKEVRFDITIDNSSRTVISWRIPNDKFKEMIESEARNRDLRRMVFNHVKRISL